MKNSELFEKAQQYIPGGVNSPVRAFSSVNRNPLFIESAKGAIITDTEKNQYIDYVGSWGPMILGHAHEEVIQAIVETAAKGTSFGAPTELEIDIAEKIVNLLPSVDMVRMVNSGTEATMSAVRLARGYTKRDDFIKFEGCYHGHGDSFLIKAGSGAMTFGEPNSPGVPADFAKHTIIAQFNDLESVDAIFKSNPDSIAAIIVEPIAGNMGVIPPAKGFLEGLRILCDKYGAVLIFDEVMAGFRVAKDSSQGLYGITPDLTTMGKIIGGGLPAAAYGGKREIMECVSPLGPVYQAGTLSGNPLAMAAGLKTLELISVDGFYDELNRKANDFFGSIQSTIDKNGYPLSLNYVNSMGCLFFTEGGVTNFSEASASDTEKFAKFFGLLLDNGVYIAPSQFEATFISMAHSDAMLEKTLGVMDDALKELF